MGERGCGSEFVDNLVNRSWVGEFEWCNPYMKLELVLGFFIGIQV